MRTEHPIDIAARCAGSQTELARLLGVTPAAITQWRPPYGGVPLRHCVRIEQLTGGLVTRRDLRPDDWRVYWPELDELDNG